MPASSAEICSSNTIKGTSPSASKACRKFNRARLVVFTTHFISLLFTKTQADPTLHHIYWIGFGKIPLFLPLYPRALPPAPLSLPLYFTFQKGCQISRKVLFKGHVMKCESKKAAPYGYGFNTLYREINHFIAR